MEEKQTTEFVILFTSLLSGRTQLYCKDKKIVKYNHRVPAINQTEFMKEYADDIQVINFDEVSEYTNGTLPKDVL